MISCDVSSKHPASAQPLRLAGLMALICMLSVPQIEAASIYKTYDAQGNVVFTDQPVDEASAELMAPPEVNVSDPLPVAPQMPPQVPADTTPVQITDTPTALIPPAAVLPAASQGTLQTPASAAQAGTPTAANAIETQQTPTVQPARVQATPTLSADGQAENSNAVVGSAADPADFVNDELLNERVAIPVLPEGARPPVIGTARPSTETLVSIHWPTPGEVVLSTQSPIWVELKSEPTSLKGSGLQVEVWVDDKLAVSGERPMLPLILPEIGMHKLQVRLVDGEGNSVAESDSQVMDVRLGATQSR